VISNEELELHARWLRHEDGGQRLDVSGRDVTYDDLSGMDLRFADFSRTDLSYSDLSNVDLRHAKLQGTVLRGVDLQGANLSGVRLSNVDTKYANFVGAVGLTIASDAADRLKAVAAAALAADDALEMDAWHTCRTTHCIAGWAIYLAGEPGRLLEESHGSAIAGLMLLGTEAHSHFYDSNEDARKWLQEVLER